MGSYCTLLTAKNSGGTVQWKGKGIFYLKAIQFKIITCFFLKACFLQDTQRKSPGHSLPSQFKAMPETSSSTQSIHPLRNVDGLAGFQLPSGFRHLLESVCLGFLLTAQWSLPLAFAFWRVCVPSQAKQAEYSFSHQRCCSFPFRGRPQGSLPGQTASRAHWPGVPPCLPYQPSTYCTPCQTGLCSIWGGGYWECFQTMKSPRPAGPGTRAPSGWERGENKKRGISMLYNL